MPRGIPNNKRASRTAERRALRPAILDPNQFYSIDETAAARDKSRAGIYQEIAAGVLKATKDGKRTKILGAEIIRANQRDAEQTAA
ncbi:MAG TPA: hypothetical protein VF329_03465 [Gammaproteobacteria bacterium]